MVFLARGPAFRGVFRGRGLFNRWGVVGGVAGLLFAGPFPVVPMPVVVAGGCALGWGADGKNSYVKYELNNDVGSINEVVIPEH